VGRSLEIEAIDPVCVEPIRQHLVPGNGRIRFVVNREPGKRYEIDIGPGWKVDPALAGALRELPGVVDVRLG
jgi:hypothetical protein